MSSTIVSIHSYTENYYVSLECGSNDCWIGLTDSFYEGRFRWVDGTSLDYTRWDSLEPNNYNGVEDMAHMIKTGYWNDHQWENSFYVICMKQNPTPSPTREPSYQWPTCRPTTLVPTKPPSPYPTTEMPTNGPTRMPTVRPTYFPTVLPSVRPTYFPSVLPSLEPTYSPSVLPTFGPTHSPSHSPTYGPSRGPTPVPSIGPTSYPSVSPSMSPTSYPSDLPSLRPTTSPSVAPTFLPSVSPSSLPSVQPTTLSPTMYPSEPPTSPPTASPTFPIAQYCIERVKVHVAFILLAGFLIITICALFISLSRRSGLGVVSPKIFSPKRLFIERIGERSKPKEMSIISMENIAIERIPVTEPISDDQVEQTL